MKISIKTDFYHRSNLLRIVIYIVRCCAWPSADNHRALTVCLFYPVQKMMLARKAIMSFEGRMSNMQCCRCNMQFCIKAHDFVGVRHQWSLRTEFKNNNNNMGVKTLLAISLCQVSTLAISQYCLKLPIYFLTHKPSIFSSWCSSPPQLPPRSTMKSTWSS